MKVPEVQITITAAVFILGLVTHNPIALALSPFFLLDKDYLPMIAYGVITISTLQFGGLLYTVLLIPALLLASEKYYYIPFIIWVITDIASTLYLYSTGNFRELNPIIASMIRTSVPTFVLVKLFALGIAIVGVKITPKENRKIVMIVMSVLTFFPGAMNTIYLF